MESNDKVKMIYNIKYNLLRDSWLDFTQSEIGSFILNNAIKALKIIRGQGIDYINYHNIEVIDYEISNLNKGKNQFNFLESALTKNKFFKVKVNYIIVEYLKNYIISNRY